MTLDQIDRYRLYGAGFTYREIDELDKAVGPDGKPQPPIDLNSPAWQAALDNRAMKTDQIRVAYLASHGKQLDRANYDRIINQWYSKGLRKSPWDWLKITYQPRTKTDFQAAVKRRIEHQQGELLKSVRRAR